jgi:Flp pilus assembly protein TadD
MSLDGSNHTAILGRGNVCAELGNQVGACRDYARVFHIYPRSTDALVNMAYMMQTIGKPKIAWKYFTMAYTVNPKCTMALEGRALVNSSLDNPFAAYLDITMAIV